MRPCATPFALLALVLCLAASSARANCSSHPADVAPGILGSEVPTPTWTIIGNGVVDVQDVLALLNAAVGNYELAWMAPVEAGCLALPGNVAPGDQDDGFSPPRWTPDPDFAVDVSDVLVGLRMAVSLVAIDPAWLEPILAEGQVGDRVVAGSVIDSVSSLGLPGVVVTALLEQVPVGETQSDDDGNFLLQGLPSGTLQLRVDGSGSTAAGKFSSIQLEIVVDMEETTSLQAITLPDESDPAGATGKFTGDETGTVTEGIDLSSGDGDVALTTGPGGKITVDDQPADTEVDLSVVPLGGEDLPEDLTDDGTGEGLNSTGEVAVGPAGGKFTAGGSGFRLKAVGGDPGFDLTLPNRGGLPVDTVVDIWHWNGSAWANCTAATGRTGVVVDLGGGMTAVFAEGVATEGGLYAAALPIDFFCTSSAYGNVTDDSGTPLAGVFVGTSLGASAFTDEFGDFFLADLPAYSGVDLGDCAPRSFDVFVRAGVELGGPTAVINVDAMNFFVGDFIDLGTTALTVPDEGCLSGLVLRNGVAQSGPVAITGPETAMLTADAEGRFALTGLTPGAYRASFLFSGEMIAREFDFEIVARSCTTVRLALNQGAGTSRLTVEVRFDRDDDFLSPNGLLPGARVRVVGSDGVSSAGLEAITGMTGRVVFDGVSPPYRVVAIREMSLAPPELLPSDYPFARLGAGMDTMAPSGFVSLLLRPPALFDEPQSFPDGEVYGTLTGAPTPQAGQHLFAGAVRRGIAWDEPWSGFVDPGNGDYFTNGYFGPFDVVFGLRDDAFPEPVLEMAFFGPLQVPVPATPEGGGSLMMNFNYADGDLLTFDQVLPVSYSGFLTSANLVEWAVSGSRLSDGRSFWTSLGLDEGIAGFPTSVKVPAPASTDLDLQVEFVSEPDGPDLPGQICLLPLSNPLPAMLSVAFPTPPSIDVPAGIFTTLDLLVNSAVEYGGASGGGSRGFDVVSYETVDGAAGPGELALASFRLYGPAQSAGAATLGQTTEPFAFTGLPLVLGVECFRGDGLPLSFTDMFGPGMEGNFQAITHQPAPTCLTFTSRTLTVQP